MQVMRRGYWLQQEDSLGSVPYNAAQQPSMEVRTLPAPPLTSWMLL